MDERKLEEILHELNEVLRGDQPRSQVWAGKPHRMIFVTANRAGLLSLAKHFLAAALSPPSNLVSVTPPVEIDESHEQILNSEDDRVIGFIQHESVVPVPDETQVERLRERRKGDWPMLVGCAIVILIVGGMLVTGFNTWVRFIFDAS